jgi:hypothetical protein
MSGKTSKLLRKIAKVSGRTPKYVKKEYKKMSPSLKQQYLLFVKTMFKSQEGNGE